MRKIVFLILLVTILAACKTTKYTNPHIAIETQFGDIELELYPSKAPKTVAAFLFYIDSGFYERSSFYRVLNLTNQPSDVLKTELIQGGIWRTNNKRVKSLAGIPHESTQQTGLQHKTGTISMARLAPGTATSEFFICIKDEPGLDFNGENAPDKQGFAAFGKVVKGMGIVRKVYQENDNDQAFDPPITIFKIVRL